jgi:transcriptional regulator GlxA family with amidase domain
MPHAGEGQRLRLHSPRQHALTTVGPRAGTMLSATETVSVGIVLFDDVEVLDFCGPFEVFSVTRIGPGEPPQRAGPYRVHLVAETDREVLTVGGMRVLPQGTFEACPVLDVLVVPGGWGTRAQLGNETMLRFLREQSARVSLITSVCTGSLLLAKAGLLEGRRATSHWQVLDLMAEMFPGVAVERSLHVVEDGEIITSAGISAGIDMALRVVARQLGEQVARETARQMEYPYPESDQRRISF